MTNLIVNNTDHSVFDLEWAKRGGVAKWNAWIDDILLKYVVMGANSEAIYGGYEGEILLGYDQTVIWVNLNSCDLIEQSIGGMSSLRMATPDECKAAGVEYIEPPPRWLPIETAPKDGSWVTVFDGETVHPDYWLGSDIQSWSKTPYRLTPTHWMPLPQPPKESS